MPTQEEFEDQNILKVDLTTEAPTWETSSPEFSRQRWSMFNYTRQFVSLNTPARGQLFINSITSYVYDAADDMDDYNCISPKKALNMIH